MGDFGDWRDGRIGQADRTVVDRVGVEKFGGVTEGGMDAAMDGRFSRSLRTLRTLPVTVLMEIEIDFPP